MEVLRGHEFLSHPFAVTLYGGEVYWTDWRTNTLAKANKWTGHNVTVVQRTNTQPFDLQVYHPSRQPMGKGPALAGTGRARVEVGSRWEGPGRDQHVTRCLLSGSAPNPCEANGGRGPCSHLCLINYNRTVSCACPHLMKLKDNTTCYGRKPLPPTDTGKLRLNRRMEVLVLSKGLAGRKDSKDQYYSCRDLTQATLPLYGGSQPVGHGPVYLW